MSNGTSAIASEAPGLWQAQERLRNARRRLEDIDIVSSASGRDCAAIDELLGDIGRRIDDLRVSVALLGESNAGKSTLINAIIGAPVLPTSGAGPGTSAGTSVTYRPGARYQAVVDFVSSGELLLQCQQLFENEKVDGADAGIDLDFSDMVQASRKRLSRVFGASLTDYLKTGNLASLRELPEAGAILAEGQRVLEATSAEQLQADLFGLLAASSRLWHLVRHVAVAGPFDALRSGTTLIDLPGLNDPDPQRTEIAKRHLANAERVWVVFAMDVGFGKALLRGVQSMLPLHELLLDGHAGSIRFIGSKADVLAHDEVRRLGLPDAASQAEILRARNDDVHRQVHDAIDFLITPMQRNLGSRAEEAIQALRASPFDPVSAIDALRVDGLHPGAPRTESIGASGIAVLREHLHRLGEAFVPAEGLHDIDADLDTLEHLIDEVAVGRSGSVAGTQPPKLNPLLHAFVSEADAARQNFALDIAGTVDHFMAQMGVAANLSFEDLEFANGRWEQLTPKTLRATLLRRGLFVGQGGHHDLNADIAQDFLLGIHPDWTKFFEQSMPARVSEFQDHIGVLTDKAAKGLSGALGRGATRPVRGRQFERDAMAALRDQRTDMRGAIVDAVRDQLLVDYERLASVRGTGMRAAVIAGLLDAATARRAVIRTAVIECVRRWMSELTHELGVLAQDEIDNRAGRLAKF